MTVGIMQCPGKVQLFHASQVINMHQVSIFIYYYNMYERNIKTSRIYLPKIVLKKLKERSTKKTRYIF